MDVNEVLRDLRRALQDWRIAATQESALNAATEIVNDAEALDEWLSQGGYLPADWSAKRVVPTREV